MQTGRVEFLNVMKAQTTAPARGTRPADTVGHAFGHWDRPEGIGCEVEFAISHAMSGCVQLLKINGQNRREVGHQSSACAQQFWRTKKTRSSDAAVRKQRACNRVVQSWAKFKKAGSRLAKTRFKKHLHACIVASHVVNRARDACCPQSLT